jgi:hypothetical protein
MEAMIVRLIIVLPMLPHGPICLVRMVRKTLARLNLIHHPHEADGVFLKKVVPTNSLIFASIRASRMGATRGVENSGSSHHCGRSEPIGHSFVPAAEGFGCLSGRTNCRVNFAMLFQPVQLVARGALLHFSKEAS